jgi:predicted nucleic acid-binding protein
LVTLDTSAVVALLDRRDKNHLAIVEVVKSNLGNLVIPAPVVAEIAHFIERDLGQIALTTFVADIRSGAYQVDCCDDDWERASELIEKYADFPLGLADSIVIACAERRGGSVATFDLRHFGAVAREGTIEVLPGFQGT